MKAEPIDYKGWKAMPGSELHDLLSESRTTKDQKAAQDLRKKADQCYTECHQRYIKSIGGQTNAQTQ